MGKKAALGLIVTVLSVALLLSFAACKGPTGPEGPQGIQGVAGPTGTSIGTIEGKVTALATGKGVEKASVTTNPVTVSATTDADGKYKIENVPIGGYSIKATAAGYNAASSQASITAGKSVTANFALAVEEPFALAKVRAVSFRTNDGEKYPAGTLRLTTHYLFDKTPTMTHNENDIVTSGLPNVGVGSYVYLEGREADHADKALSGWEWSVVGPGESTVTVENPTSRTPRFMASKTGKYEVKISATNADGVKASSELVVFAGTYVGQAVCITCHSGSVMPDVFAEFQQTGHTTKLINTYASYSPTSDYCIGCHTTGYNESDKAGGFDDLAKQAGWDSTKESLTAWLKNNKWTVDQIMNSIMGKLANVQCEACHGPGQIHEAILTAKETTALMQPGVCSQCHPQEAQWRNSGHSNTGSVQMHMAEGTSCVECHTGQGFVEVKIRGNAPVFPSQATAEQPATLAEPSQQAPVACAACHDPHAFPEPFNKGTADKPNIASLQLRVYGNVTMPNGATVNAQESAVCVSCHANKRDLAYKANYLAGKNSRGPHDNAQADSFYGVNAAAFDFGGSPYSSSPHKAVVTEGCIQCHMAPNPPAPAGAVADGVKVVSSHGALVLYTAGDHTWSMSGAYGDTTIENIGACTGCHAGLTTFNRPAYGDYDGDGVVEGIQDEVTGLLKLVAAQLPVNAAGTRLAPNAAGVTELQRQVMWNYDLINNDGSLGVHNAAYAVQVLQRTYKQITGNDVPGATIR
ncbi:MAG: carboxypeptidase regulatory-like domain-containing protein [Chloroflexi bacterium]|nr:carboxypeptidase regulatory-like domain-containing protein [Chloroflexota bacterium]